MLTAAGIMMSNMTATTIAMPASITPATSSVGDSVGRTMPSGGGRLMRLREC
jgi:hypothetical protein